MNVLWAAGVELRNGRFDGKQPRALPPLADAVIRVRHAAATRKKKEAIPRGAVHLFRPELSNYSGNLTIPAAVRFRRQAR